MNKYKIIYWISTVLFCVFLLLTSISYLTDPQFVGIFKHLGFPQYFRIELAIAKIAGVFILLIPRLPIKLKEWTYAGFGITVLSGSLAHFKSGDPSGYVINALFWFIPLAISYIYWHKIQQEKQSALI